MQHFFSLYISNILCMLSTMFVSVGQEIRVVSCVTRDSSGCFMTS
jgi:hypothetical protein